MLLVVMPLFLVTFLQVAHGGPSSILLLVVMPGATNSVFATSSDALYY